MVCLMSRATSMRNASHTTVHMYERTPTCVPQRHASVEACAPGQMLLLDRRACPQAA